MVMCTRGGGSPSRPQRDRPPLLLPVGQERRQAQLEARAAAGSLVDCDRAAVRLGDLAHDRQAQAGAGTAARAAAAVEAVKDVGAVRGRNAGAMVAHRQHAAPQVDLDDRPVGAVLRRVVEQVVDCPPEALGHALDDGRRQLGGERRGRPAAARALHGLGDERVELHLLDLDRRLVAAGELDDVGDERAELLGLGADVLEQAAAVLVGQVLAR
jgi:hypothetical protein